MIIIPDAIRTVSHFHWQPVLRVDGGLFLIADCDTSLTQDAATKTAFRYARNYAIDKGHRFYGAIVQCYAPLDTLSQSL